MGFPSTREGGGLPVEVLRRLAHFLILEASGRLEPPKVVAPTSLDTTATAAAAEESSRSRKRPAVKVMEEEKPSVAEEQVGIFDTWAIECLRNKFYGFKPMRSHQF